MEQNDLVFIQDQIGYKFNNPDLLQQAFTRRSYTAENGGENNEVLEFIGDKVLDLCVIRLLVAQHSNAVALFKKFGPQLKNSWQYTSEARTFPEENTFISGCSEAELTEIKKLLVQKKTLANRIDDMGIACYLRMGNGDALNNMNEENSVKEDLFEAILGAIAIDSNWDMEAMQCAVEIMLAPEIILAEHAEEEYVSLIQEWVYTRTGGIPLYHFEERDYQSTWYEIFPGIQQHLNFDDELVSKAKYHCLLRLADDLPIFRGFGRSKAEARKNVCQLAYEHLCKEGLWLSIRDEIDNPNKDDSISQLEILARRGYFSVPTYSFAQTYDTNGNPIWKSTCSIAEKDKVFSAESSSKKDAKKSAAYKMLQYVLSD